MKATRVGLDQMYYAVLTSDAPGVQTTYNAPVQVPKAITAGIQPKSNTAVLYADDGPSETATAIGEITVDFEAGILPASVLADLLGATIGADGTLLQKSTDVAPYVALGFRSKKSNGKYRYKWLYKGKFMWNQETYSTEAGTPKFEPEKISGIFIRRDFDSALQLTGDEDDVTFTGGTTWFNAVQNQAADLTALTVTVTPADAATAIVITTSVVWLFSKAIQAALVTAANFFTIDPSGAQVAGTLSISTDQKTVTFAPTSSLTALTAYTAIATTNVKDIAGVALAANSVTNFTTA